MTDHLQVLGTTVAGKYDVVEFLFQHGARFGYRGLHREWGEPVFIEFAVFDRSTDPAVLDAQRRAFTRAGAQVARLCTRSTAVPHTRDGGTVPTAQGELPYAVSEWIEGTTVAEALAKARRSGREKFPPELVVDWFQPLMDALVLAHSDGIVHAHVEPDTLMVTGGAFGSRGLIKVLALVDAAWRMSLPGGALPAVLVPKPYAAPELKSADPSLLGPWTDVYGVAAVMVELISGAADRTQWSAKLPDELRFAFDKALATRIDERFKSLPAFRAALEEGIDNSDFGRQRNPRRTMVVSEAVPDLEGSAGSFESSDSHDAAPPVEDAKRPRVRLAFTQPSIQVPDELLSSPSLPPVDPRVGSDPHAAAVPDPMAQSGQTMPAMPLPAPVQTRSAAVVPLLVLAIVVAASFGAAVGYFILK